MLGRAAAFAAFLFSTAAMAAPPVDSGMLGRISDEAFNHGEVVETAAFLADQIGGRLTNSPAMRKAESWTQDRFRQWGLTNVHSEGFEFGRGWSSDFVSARMIAPRALTLRAIAITWTPATAGPLTAPVIVAPMRRERDFAAWHGKLAGRIVLFSYPADPSDATDAPFRRLDEAALKKLDQYSQPNFDPDAIDLLVKRRRFTAALDAFAKAEGAVALVRMSARNNGLLVGSGSGYEVGKTAILPAIELAAEDYRRLARLAKVGPVSLELESRVRFDDSDTKAYNVLADIPGSDPKAGYVMAGAHLDSWVAGDGAADNGAGSAMVMEAARILARLGVKPKRTIRFALWAAEEQGLIGSTAYVDQHLARRPVDPDPEKAALGSFRFPNFPITPLPGLRDLVAYFNIDNGSGKLRGIYAEGNYGAAAIFKDWLAPFASMGAATVVAQPTGSTDHVVMQRLGLPAFQFIQDPLDYSSTVHHSSVDTFDHLRAADMRQGAVILATMLLDAANADQPLPRLPLPTQPRPTDPFHYADPDDQP
jgi:hypothetical protein